ncbi:hypothetical protein [Pseudonocardia sp.]|uniref:hypothetical protein n=1 Tax=Pseudonocardia sp. TaxID=60912 RepID=UPI003D101BBB
MSIEEHQPGGPPARLAASRPATRPDEIKLSRIAELLYLIDRMGDAPVRGPFGQQMTLLEAQDWCHSLGADIAHAKAQRSRRHDKVTTSAKVSAVLFLALIDLPIMLWLAAAVFNVDWSAPIGLPLAISIVVSLLATAGSAAALHHIGHDLREHKSDTGKLAWRELSTGAVLAVLAVALLVPLVAVVMFVRVYTEGVLSGLTGLAVLLAALVALVMLISAGLVFWTAFRDGSPERDELEQLTTLVNNHLDQQRAYQHEVMELSQQYQMLRSSEAH